MCLNRFVEPGLSGYQYVIASRQAFQAGDKIADDAEEGDEEGDADDEVAVPGHAADGIIVGDGLFCRVLLEHRQQEVERQEKIREGRGEE